MPSKERGLVMRAQVKAINISIFGPPLKLINNSLQTANDLGHRPIKYK